MKFLDPSLLEKGERNCQECGKPHDSWYPEDYPSNMAPTWKSQDDGHPYRPESWETIARRCWAEHARDPDRVSASVFDRPWLKGTSGAS